MEAVDAIDCSRLVISSEHEEVPRVSNLAGKHEQYQLHILRPTVHIVAQEEVVAHIWKSFAVEHPHQIVELSMKVATDDDRRIDPE